MARDILRVQDLRVNFTGPQGSAAAVDGVSFSVKAGETTALVGESGCGKSVTALAILRLIPTPPGHIEHGVIEFDGNDVLALNNKELYRLRGNRISMIFQEPMTSLNPVLTIGLQLTEGLTHHRGLSRQDAKARAIEMLHLVRIPEPETRMLQYPHQLSGGMRQRVMIAIALANEPQLLIADEPTTALDVTIQAQILDLMVELQEKLGMAIILITHDLGVVAEMADRVIVMYAGRVVEEASITDFFDRPLHPYSRGLLRSVPHLDQLLEEEKGKPLVEMPGVVPSIHARPPGCQFAPRCGFATNRCHGAAPEPEEIEGGRRVACWEVANIA